MLTTTLSSPSGDALQRALEKPANGSTIILSGTCTIKRQLVIGLCENVTIKAERVATIRGEQLTVSEDADGVTIKNIRERHHGGKSIEAIEEFVAGDKWNGRCLVIGGPRCTIDHCSLQLGSDDIVGPAGPKATDCTIRNCIISHPVGAFGQGVLSTSPGTTIRESLIVAACRTPKMDDTSDRPWTLMNNVFAGFSYPAELRGRGYVLGNYFAPIAGMIRRPIHNGGLTALCLKDNHWWMRKGDGKRIDKLAGRAQGYLVGNANMRDGEGGYGPESGWNVLGSPSPWNPLTNHAILSNVGPASLDRLDRAAIDRARFWMGEPV